MLRVRKLLKVLGEDLGFLLQGGESLGRGGAAQIEAPSVSPPTERGGLLGAQAADRFAKDAASAAQDAQPQEHAWDHGVLRRAVRYSWAPNPATAMPTSPLLGTVRVARFSPRVPNS